jgi:hypothetical protein
LDHTIAPDVASKAMIASLVSVVGSLKLLPVVA